MQLEEPSRRPRAAIYCRISETDEKFDKVEEQQRVLRTLCSREGYVVVAVYSDDGLSAFKEDVTRPQYQRLLQDLRSGAFDVITATFQDRLSRRPVEIAVLADECERRDVFWHLASEGKVDCSDSTSLIVASIRGHNSRDEISKRSKRQRSRYNAQRQAGRPLWGVRPFGFETDRITHRATEAAELRWAYDQVADGATIHSIIKSWNQRGVTTSNGKMWSYASVQQLLKRPSNAGLMQVDGAIDESVSVVWEPLVDRELWEQVSSLVSKEPGAVARQFEPRWLLSGLARCGLCGQPFRSATGSDRKSSYPVYRCKRSVLPAVPPEYDEYGKKLRHASARCADLDAMARNAVVSAFMFAPRSLLPADHESASDLRRARAELSEVVRERTAVSESIGMPGTVAHVLHRRASELADRESELRAEIDATLQKDARTAMADETRRAMMSDPDGRVSIEDAAAYKSELGERFDSLKLAQRRTLVDGMLDVLVYPGRSPERFVMWHKVATSLNDGHAEQPVPLRPAVSIVG